MKKTRIPVWLLTGFLGSGKTTLLKAWLGDPALAHAAVVVNEIGEIGLDDRLLDGAVDRAALLANTCVCCTGLSGLEDALSTMWWDRLYRRRDRFDAVVIETTGLADPVPIRAAFEQTALLRERYELCGVIVTASATAALEVIDAHDEARSQLLNADLVIVTKVDRADDRALRQQLQALNPRASQVRSANASLGWAEVQELMQGGCKQPNRGPLAAIGAHDHHAHPSARFLALPEPVSLSFLQQQLAAMPTGSLLRVKGVVRLDDGTTQAVQWSLGDDSPSLTPFQGHAPALGLTCITG